MRHPTPIIGHFYDKRSKHLTCRVLNIFLLRYRHRFFPKDISFLLNTGGWWQKNQRRIGLEIFCSFDGLSYVHVTLYTS